MMQWHGTPPRLLWAAGPVDKVLDEAAREGFAGRVNGPPSKAALLDEIASALAFPDWFGRNWDALDDCLGDLSWLPVGPISLVWADPRSLRDADPPSYATAIEILSDAAAASVDSPRPFYPVLIQ
jgi:RNAse (barnase) inhibitor barstar